LSLYNAYFSKATVQCRGGGTCVGREAVCIVTAAVQCLCFESEMVSS